MQRGGEGREEEEGEGRGRRTREGRRGLPLNLNLAYRPASASKSAIGGEFFTFQKDNNAPARQRARETVHELLQI